MQVSEQILEIIRKSSLSKEDIALWEQAIVGIPTQFQSGVLQYLSTTVGGARLLTESIKSKLGALRKGDLAEWGKIIMEDAKKFDIIK